MAYSMTGFGRGEAASANYRFTVEIKSVNHRFCDVSVRLPRMFAVLEEHVRKLITAKINRGKVDAFVSYEEIGERERRVFTDIGLARAYIEAAGVLKSRFSLDGDVSVSMLLRLPDIVNVENAGSDDAEAADAVCSATKAALDALLDMRRREGQKLADDIRLKVAAISEMLLRIEARAPLVVGEYREKLHLRMKELLEQNVVDENRLAAEIAVFAERCSIDEEIIRFKSHLGQAGGCCASTEPIGRKLDFIMQEINREINTIGSKANDLIISDTVLEIKSEAEKIREQLQNLE